ncbi:MAG: glutamate 5-kinase [Nitrospirae bacterium]|nr:glutamate 5-kinase [Nitrospirota bacterium]
MNLDRKEVLHHARRVVVKVGASVLAPDGKPKAAVFSTLARQIAGLSGRKIQVVLVSSGAVASGRPVLGYSSNSISLEDKQAAAAVGQSLLMEAYRKAFSRLRGTVAQVLLTHDDFANRRRFLNARSTLNILLERRILPIVNENDTVATEEISIGDNDNLSALVASMIEADVLILLTNTNGLHDQDPNRSKDAQRIPLIVDVDETTARKAGGTASPYTVGGMLTKVEAAKKAALSGIPTVVADGRNAGVLPRLLKGEDLGTLFLPSPKALKSRKQWIAFSVKPKGKLILDEGACRAVQEQRKSLLPSGISHVEGDFDRGDAVSLATIAGQEIARGLTNYSSKELSRIRGVKSSSIESILGYKISDEVVHRDNLVTL